MSFSRPALGLLAAACAAVLIHGYHLGADDAAIYVPAIKQAADPLLYPFGAEFFRAQAGWSLAPWLMGGTARMAHAPADLWIFLWHIAGIYLLLLAAWQVLCACFESAAARWGGALLLAASLSVPVAGTALVIMDPYVTARSLATPAALFAVAASLGRKLWWTVAGTACVLVLHPQMGFFAAAFVLILTLPWNRDRTGAATLGLLPFGYGFEPAQGPAGEALRARTYFFITNWAWYEWIGAVAPVAILGWFATLRPRGATPAFRRLARTLAIYGIVFTAAALILASSARLETFNRLQPMRAFHLLYCIFFVLLGGLAGEYLLRGASWRWAAFFAPLAAGMWLLQAGAYPSSPHVEWPGDHAGGSWMQAFYWIRGNTPKDAVFAIDPDYFARPGEDQHGFRAVAERSVLADELKDSGPVALFPRLAVEWKRQVSAQAGWDKFGRQDFERLARQYGVNWILTRAPGPEFATCPYQNRDLAVCQMPGF